jgi:hypothetical protein
LQSWFRVVSRIFGLYDYLMPNPDRNFQYPNIIGIAHFYIKIFCLGLIGWFTFIAFFIALFIIAIPSGRFMLDLLVGGPFGNDLYSFFIGLYSYIIVIFVVLRNFSLNFHLNLIQKLRMFDRNFRTVSLILFSLCSLII